MQFSCTGIIEPEEMPDFGIPVYEIDIKPENYAQFNANIFTNYSIVAELKIDDKNFNIKIEHQGWTSRELFKKSYEINFLSGNKDPILNRSEIILSSQATDPSMLRTLIAGEAFRAVGLKTYKTTPVFLYMNNEPQGLYLLTEPINEEFFADRDYPLGELYKAINTKAQFSMKNGFSLSEGFQKRIPDDDNFYSLENLIYVLDTEPVSRLPQKLNDIFDIDNYLKYCAVTSLIGNWDGIVHNFYLSKNKVTNIFEFVPWDFDLTFYSYQGGVISLNSNLLFDKIMSVYEYSEKYTELIHLFSENNLSKEFFLAKIEEYKILIETAYNSDRLIHTMGYNLDTEADNIRSFILSGENF